MLGLSAERVAGQIWTMNRWLDYWLASRRTIRLGTYLSYESAIRLYLKPRLGHLRVAEVTRRDVAAMFRALECTPTRRGTPHTPGGLQGIRSVLKAAMNGAIREDLNTVNPATHIELAGPRRPHAVFWTDARIANWEATGARPAVAVWTVPQLVGFLAAVKDDDLYALWWLIALRGLHRGEACGLTWSNIDLDRGEMIIDQQLTTEGGCDGTISEPKSQASNRVVALDAHTVKLLRAHQVRYQQLRMRAGRRWRGAVHGLVFTRDDGSPLRPNSITHLFRRITGLAGLPPVRLHDLRHGAATLAHAAGMDLKTIQDLLGHSTIVITADIYTSVLAQVQRRAAEDTARLVLAAAGQISVKILGKRRRHCGPAPAHPGRASSAAPRNEVPATGTRDQRHRNKAARKRRLRRHRA